MTQEHFDQITKDLLDSSNSIANAKRPGYTQASSDVLANFKVAAEQMGVTPLQAWGIYFWKHVSAILTYAKDRRIPQAESIKGRFCDAINYLELGYALGVEEVGK